MRPMLVCGCALLAAACGGSSGDDSMPTGDLATVISGKATFDLVPHNSSNGLDYGATERAPIRGAPIQALTSGNTLLATAITDENGDYSLTVQGNGSVRIRVRAVLQQTVGTPFWDFRVMDNTAGNAVYVLDTESFPIGGGTLVKNVHAASGWDGTAYGGERAAGPFAILDALYKSHNKVLAVMPDAQFPQLNVNWSPQNRPVDGDLASGEIGTSFYWQFAGTSEIYLLGAANNDTDEYDDHVVIHEFGHYLEDRFARSDSIGGAHSNGDRLDPRVAFSEGLGYAFAGIVTDDPVSRDSGGFNQLSGFEIDVEDSVNLNPGWYSEGSVQSIIYDLYDVTPDGKDNLALGFQPIFDVIVGPVADDPALATIFSFLTHLKTARPADAPGIDAIVAKQDIVSVAIDAYGSNETNSAGGSQDVLPVYTNLPLDGSPANVCSIGGSEGFGQNNKLSNRRFLRFVLQSGARVRFTASGPSDGDPDMILHQRGVVAIAEGVASSESFQQDLRSGEYVLEVYEFSNLTDTPRGRTCIDVSATLL